ncbi:unnamed protein product [Adineta ricciae]|uniref:Uncharacterized protein n=1 Tax=Adineta ricciae TaxID=249248 RepID=A0A814VK37_ADIRI|nr:unnamed protein product [Adineta ricciae]CAF1641189.1 unnamed protein product [Adineta ricciae]
MKVLCLLFSLRSSSIPVLPYKKIATSITNTVSLPQQCYNYTTIVNETRLTTDLLIFRQYVRFVNPSGTQLATTTPNNASGWTISGYPSIAGLTIDVIVCFAFDDNPCFGYIYGIQITNCNRFYVHGLYAAPVCYYRYCTQ